MRHEQMNTSNCASVHISRTERWLLMNFGISASARLKLMLVLFCLAINCYKGLLSLKSSPL